MSYDTDTLELTGASDTAFFDGSGSPSIYLPIDNNGRKKSAVDKYENGSAKECCVLGFASDSTRLCQNVILNLEFTVLPLKFFGSCPLRKYA